MANYQAGFNAKASINGGVYRIASYRCHDRSDDQNVSNSEGVPGNPSASGGAGGFIDPSAESRIVALQHMEADVRNACFDSLANPFATPTGSNTALAAASQVNSGQFINLQIFPAGRSGVSWWSPSFLVLDASQEMDIKGIQPVSFNGKSDGWYRTPWE